MLPITATFDSVKLNVEYKDHCLLKTSLLEDRAARKMEFTLASVRVDASVGCVRVNELGQRLKEKLGPLYRRQAVCEGTLQNTMHVNIFDLPFTSHGKKRQNPARMYNPVSRSTFNLRIKFVLHNQITLQLKGFVNKEVAPKWTRTSSSTGQGHPSTSFCQVYCTPPRQHSIFRLDAGLQIFTVRVSATLLLPTEYFQTTFFTMATEFQRSGLRWGKFEEICGMINANIEDASQRIAANESYDVEEKLQRVSTNTCMCLPLTA